ncbi:MAG: FAD:protein FMN transferase [Sphingomicrobium sp.]
MPELIRRCRPLLGTFVEISADDEAAIDAGFDAVDRVHKLMSAHEPGSDISRVNRFGHLRPVQVHDWTVQVINRALFWSKHSEGGFDVLSAGKAAIGSGLLPRHPDQPQPEGPHWTWIEVQGASVRLLGPGCIDLGGIAKGFAVDRAVDALRAAGCARGLVNAGGDIFAFGPEAWDIEVHDPRTRRAAASVSLHNQGLATSAGLPDSAGKLSFGHLVQPNCEWISVTAAADTCTDADALTKALWSGASNAASLLQRAAASAFVITRAGAIRPVEPELEPA